MTEQTNFILEYANKLDSSKRIKKQYAKLKEQIENPTGNYIYNHKKAMRAVEFIELFCKHSKGKWYGKPLALELFQKAYISALFGFVDKETGLRQYRESLFMVGRKNGKSTMLAGIALYMLIADGEAGAEVYSVATKLDQSKLIFDETHNMIKQSRALSKLVHKGKTDLSVKATFSKFQPLGRDSNSLDGLNSHLVIIDELHAIKDRNLYEVMKQSMSSREQPLLLMITTAGTVRENIFDDIYQYACNVVDGTFEDDTFLPIIYELDERNEWSNPDAWIKANPALGTIKSLSYLETAIERAKNNPSDLRGILVKDFNIRDNTNDSWLNLSDIQNDETFELEDFRDFYAIGGADLSMVSDLTCATLLLIDPETEIKYITQMYFLPEGNFKQRVERENIPYDKWLEQGLIRLCHGNKINFSDITAWFLEVARGYDIMPQWIYYDSWSANYWIQEMENYGFNMIPVHQGAKSLSLPMQVLGQDLKDKQVNYNNNPLLEWNISNVGIQTDTNGNIKPVKALGAKARIDGLSSLLNAYVGLQEHYNEFKEVQPRKEL